MAKPLYVYTGSDWVPVATELSDLVNYVTKNNSEANYLTLKSPKEIITVSATALSGSTDIDLLTSSVYYYTSDASGVWGLNFRGDASTSLNSILSIGQSISCAVLVTQGATAYYHDGTQVDSASPTVKWQGGTAPTSGNANSIDVYSFTIIKTADAVFTVLASQTQFA